MGLKLIANDADDLRVLAAALQDAILRVGDIRFDPVGRALTLTVSRYRHEVAKPSRILCGVRVDGVMALQSHGLDRTQSDAFAVLLDASFEADDPPAGTLLLTLAGGGMMRMQVEGLDITLADAGEAKRASRKPSHEA